MVFGNALPEIICGQASDQNPLGVAWQRLQPGHFKSGFSPRGSDSGALTEGGERAVVSIHRDVGSVSESFKLTATPAVINTESATVSDVRPVVRVRQKEHAPIATDHTGNTNATHRLWRQRAERGSTPT